MSVSAVRFAVVPQDEIENTSAVHVTDSTLHHRNSARADSLLDPRFGAVNRFNPCGTCGRTLATCPSHPGHMTLPIPLPHVAFKGLVHQLLNVVCCNCSWLLASDADRRRVTTVVQHEKKRAANAAGCRRLTALYACMRARRAAKPVVCHNPDCRWPQPTTEMSEPYFIHRWDTALLDASPDLDRELLQLCYAQTFNNFDAVYLLRSIPTKDLEFLGFSPHISHPGDMLLRVMAVPGAAVRPTLHQGDGSKRQVYNQLTKILACIVKYINQVQTTAQTQEFDLTKMDNNRLPLTAGPGWTTALDQQIKSLYANIGAYMYPGRTKIPDFKMRPYDLKLHTVNSNLIDPLKGGKQGRYRQNIQGKRVDNCARTVVTPFPEGDADEVRVPAMLANVLCVGERVSQYTLTDQQARLQRGEFKHIIPDPEHAPRELIEVNAVNRPHLVLRVGQVVERSLRTGDYVIVNRQPTLHKASMMAHRVVVMENIKTIGIHTNTMPPYNCDCDGDELNLHVMQSVPATVELQELMAVSNNMMHPGSNRPAIGMIQDDVVAVWALTSQDTWLTRAELMSLIMCARYDPAADPTAPMGCADTHKQWTCVDVPPPALVKPCELWSGKQLLSMLLPPTLSLLRPGPNTGRSGSKDELIIDRGQMLTGQLCKRTVGPVANSLLHYVSLYLGYGAGCRMLSDMSRVAGAFFQRVGFSMGIDDCTPSTPQIQTNLKRMTDDVEHAYSADVRTRIKRMRAIAEASDDAHALDLARRAAHAGETAAVNIVRSVLDTTGKIVQLDRHNAVRIMTADAASKGTSFNSSQVVGCLGQTFVDGGRPAVPEGVRMLPSSRLPHQSEDNESTRTLLQNTGFISRPYSMGLTIEQAFMHAMGGREGLIDTARKTKVTGYLQRRLVKTLEALKCHHDWTVRNSRNSLFDRRFGGDGYEPARVFYLTKLELLEASDLVLAQSQVFKYEDLVRVRDLLRAHRITALQPALVTGATSPFSLESLVPDGVSVVSRKCAHFSKFVHYQTHDLLHKFVASVELPVAAHIMWHLAFCTRYCGECLTNLVHKMQRLHDRALLQPGDCIGALTATSLGEPATQLTLNTFHFSGTSNDGMTYGVPRMCEIIEASEHIRSPRTWVPLLPGTSHEDAQTLARSLVEVPLLNCLNASQVVYGLPDAVVLANPALFEATDTSVFMAYTVKLVPQPHVCFARLVNCIQESIGASGVVVSDGAALYVMLLRNDKDLAKALAKATSGHSAKAMKRHMRPLVFTTDDADTTITNVPLHLLCPPAAAAADAFEVQIQDVLEANMAREMLARLHETCMVGGYPGVAGATVRTQAYTRVDPVHNTIVSEQRLLLDVRGSVLGVAHSLPHVDLSNIVTNDIAKVYKMYGIDAAERVLFHEIRVCFEVGGARPDDRLVALLASVITHWGFILPVSRYGINRLADQSIIAKISFEEVVEMILSAAAQGLCDDLQGPSETIMFGKLINAGTNMCELVDARPPDPDDTTIVVSDLPECLWFIPPILVNQQQSEFDQIIDDLLPACTQATLSTDVDVVAAAQPQTNTKTYFRPSTPMPNTFFRPSTPMLPN